MIRQHPLSLHYLHRLVYEIDADDTPTINSLRAIGDLREWVVQAEVILVRMAREELLPWSEISEALMRPTDLMILLHEMGHADG